MRRTKIVCTIGPACASRAMLVRLVNAGMDVARLNFSHGNYEQHGAVISMLKAIRTGRERPLAIIQDLSGPKVRLGEITGGSITLHRGERVLLDLAQSQSAQDTLPLPVPELLAELKPRDRLLIDDGNVELRVTARSHETVSARVVTPGVVSSRKGVTAPGVFLNIPAVTEKDLEDLRFGLAQGVDWIAASYVRTPEDLAPLHALMREMNIVRPVIAKIEKMEAVRRIDDILRVADGIMVARGDLGVEIPIDQVPIVQKRIISICNRSGKPVITATQMLESMIHSPRPTRAEVTDVANAILDGSDAVMLSGETATGEYPVETVRMMSRVAARADALLLDRGLVGTDDCSPRADSVAQSVAQSTVEIAREVRAAAILCATTSGSTALLIARHRPRTAVVAATPLPETFQRLALTWGARPILIGKVRDSDEMMECTVSAAVARGDVRAGETVVLTAGVPMGVVGNTNLIRVHEVGRPMR